jgi:hypothetical protein
VILIIWKFLTLFNDITSCIILPFSQNAFHPLSCVTKPIGHNQLFEGMHIKWALISEIICPSMEIDLSLKVFPSPPKTLYENVLWVLLLKCLSGLPSHVPMVLLRNSLGTCYIGHDIGALDRFRASYLIHLATKMLVLKLQTFSKNVI